MNATQQLIEKVELLLRLIAGTQAGESEIVKEINHLISIIKPKVR